MKKYFTRLRLDYCPSGKRIDFFVRYYIMCLGDIMKEWYDVYKKLELLSGKIEFISENDQDMIEIHYDDGMLIDLGYIEDLQSYYITIVSSDDEKGWEKPLEQIEVRNKAVLFEKIQETIYKYRK